MDRVDRTFHFVEDVALQACRSSTNDMLSPWYYRTSSIWLANAHNFWDSDFAQKPKKKFGRVMRTDGENLSDMLLEQRGEVLGKLVEETDVWRRENPVSEDEGDGMEGLEGGVGAADSSSSAKRLRPVGNFVLSARASPTAGSRTPKMLSPK
jgi:histone deacetylase 6